MDSIRLMIYVRIIIEAHAVVERRDPFCLIPDSILSM
jgi:hypothetical protein